MSADLSIAARPPRLMSALHDGSLCCKTGPLRQKKVLVQARRPYVVARRLIASRLCSGAERHGSGLCSRGPLNRQRGVYVYVCVYVCMCVCMCMYVYRYVRTYVRMYVCM